MPFKRQHQPKKRRVQRTSRKALVPHPVKTNNVSVKASVKAVIEEVVSERHLTIKSAILDGLRADPPNSAPYLKMCAEYTDGKPDANIHLRTSFREDEIASAERSLARKMDRLFQRAQRLTPLTVDVTPETAEHRPGDSDDSPAPSREDLNVSDADAAPRP